MEDFILYIMHFSLKYTYELFPILEKVVSCERIKL